MTSSNTAPLCAPPDAPRRGGCSPWGAVDGVEVLAPDVVFVSTPSHGGAWLSPAAQTRMPAALQPMHGRTWWEEDCEIWAPLLVFGLHTPDNTRSQAIAILARWKPDWLDALAAPCDVVNAAQTRRIQDLKAQIAPNATVDLAGFRRSQRSGSVEGWIGGVWHTISRDGEAVG